MPKRPSQTSDIELLSNHQKSWVWGRRLVCETLEQNRWRIVELALSESLPPNELREAQARAKRHGIDCRVETPRRIEQLCHASDHQGYLAKMAAFPYAALDDVLNRVTPDSWFVLLDAIQDPYNFGAIARSAEAFGCGAILIGEERQTGVTSLSARCSAGAVNHVPIVKEPDVISIADRLKQAGVPLVGASEKADEPLDAHPFARPVCVIVGNEGEGIRNDLLKRCDASVSIPQRGRVGSLNAAAAMAVFAYEIIRQRRQ